MLAEKFILWLEAIRLQKALEEGVRVVSTSPHVPLRLPHTAGSGMPNRGA